MLKMLSTFFLNLQEGAILIFMPGWENIKKVHDEISNAPFYNPSKFQKRYLKYLFKILKLRNKMMHFYI